MQKKSFEKPKTGVFYLVPDNRNNLGKYSIYYQLDEETENPDYNLHLELWENKITKLLEIRFKNATINFDDYGGLPRGRVVERGNEWIIAWGNNFSKETYEKDILYEFNLRDANGQGKVKWEIDSHEVFDKISKDNIESSLGIKLTPEGFETIPNKTKKPQTKKKSSENIIDEILKESSIDYRQTKESEEFLSKYNLTGEDLGYLGNGDFGTAYDMGNNKVLKITSSKSEFELAKEIMKGKFTNFAKIFEVKEINSNYYIVMEKLEEDSDIEELWYRMLELLQTQGLPPQYVGNFDEEEYENEYEKIDKNLKEFMHELYNVILDYRKLGIEMTSDLRPENLGRAFDGTLKAFDIDDKR